jgi:predicted RNase H-like HicB family nuclease
MTHAATPATDDLAVPYVIAIESVVAEDGSSLRRAWHPELPGCDVSAYSAQEALEELENCRQEYIRSALERGEPLPRPRPPLRGVPVAGPSAPDATLHQHRNNGWSGR